MGNGTDEGVREQDGRIEILSHMYNIAAEPRRPLLHCEVPDYGLYLPNRASPTPRPMTMVMIKLSWNVLRRPEERLVVVFAI